MSLGILDKLSEYLTNVHGPIDENTSAVDFVQHAVSLVTAVVRVTGRRSVTLSLSPSLSMFVCPVCMYACHRPTVSFCSSQLLPDMCLNISDTSA